MLRNRAVESFRSLFVIFVATVFSIMALHNARRWHPDEAFYMTIARNAAVKGDWLFTSEPLDKPPLSYYLNALALVSFAVESDDDGVLFLDTYKGEFAGRIPATFMSILLVAVIIATAKSLYSSRVTWLAGLFVALSPLRIVFAPTAFSDMPMLLFTTISLWMAVRKRWAWAGFWFVIALAAKPQCVFYLPLLFLLLWWTHRQNGGYAVFVSGLRLLVPILVGLACLWAWDMIRIGQGAASFWALGQANYTPTHLTAFANYPARLAELWGTIQYLFGHGILTAFALLLIFITAVWQRGIALILVLWLAGFVVLHIILTLNLFDRNLILILPITALLLAQTLSQWSRRFNVMLLVAMAIFAVFAAQGRYPIGGDDGRHDGIDAVAAYLNTRPIATIIYDPWLDWELDYYMGAWTNKRRVYYPTPASLIDGIFEVPEASYRYLIAPANQALEGWLNALENAGFKPIVDYETEHFILYRFEV